MRDPRSSVHIDVVPGEERSLRTVDPDEPFRILIAGDFSGQASRRAAGGLRGRRPLGIDRDNFDDVLAGLSPQLSLGGLTLRFSQLDDFHPDQIYRLPAVQELLDHAPAAASAPPPAATPTATTAGLLDQIVESDPASARPVRVEDASDLAEFLRRVTAPHLAPRPDAGAEERRRTRERAAGELISALLHHPDFQALEAAWRGVDLLVKRLDTDGDLKLYLLDATREELTREAGAFQELLAGASAPWALCVVNFAFGRGAADVALLGTLGAAGRAAGCPAIAEGDPASVGATEPAWDALRASAEARYLGLVLPRFLLRLPYGRDTSSIDAFPYEEMPEHSHRNYLWGNPAFCCAYLMGETFLADGWEMRPGSRRRVEGLPMHVYLDDGDSCLKPCAEVLMKESDAELLMEQGIMPLASLKGEDAALVVRFQSIAQPLAALAGRWSG